MLYFYRKRLHMREIRQEITPRANDDLFIVLDHDNAKFDYPIHCHSEFEINLILHTSGSRIIGSIKDDFKNIDLILVAPFIPHVWKSKQIENKVVTIQFSGEMLNFPIILKKQFHSIRELLSSVESAARFDVREDDEIVSEILSLSSTKGFRKTTKFLEILDSLSGTPHEMTGGISDRMRPSKSRRIAKVLAYTEKHMERQIKLQEVSSLINMSDSAFSHFFKQHTALSYVTYLNGLRINKACRLLGNTMMSVSEICYECGFNNKSNFNRIFFKAKKMTPTDYRKYITRILV